MKFKCLIKISNEFVPDSNYEKLSDDAINRHSKIQKLTKQQQNFNDSMDKCYSTTQGYVGHGP
jgi:hypothetical protein